MKFNKIILISLIVVFAAICALAGCSTASPATSIAIEGEYKTSYIVGEEFNSAGIKVRVNYEDGTCEVLDFADIKASAVVMDFDTQTPVLGKNVTVKYKGLSTTFVINVFTATDYEQRFTVTYDSRGGSVVTSTYAQANGTLVAPEDPVKDGYAFDGWYKDITLVNGWNFNTDKITEDMTLYAKWSKLYSVTFRAPGMADITKLVKEGGELTDIPVVPEIAGKNGAWNRHSYANINQDLVVDAVYTDILYSVGFYYYNDNEEEIETGLFENIGYGTNLALAYADEISNIEISLSNNKNCRANYHFVGWQDEFDFIDSNMKIYAKFERDTHSVSFVYSEGGAIQTTYSVSTVPHDSPVELPTEPSREGYEFDGWYTSADYSTEWNFNSGRITTDRTIYAKWTKLWKLTFLDADADEYAIVYVRNGDDAEVPVVPANEGYDGKWDRDLFTAISADDTIRPIYTIKSYTVCFRNYDQTIILVDGEEYQTVEYNNAATLPDMNPTREGYTFKNWNLDYEHIKKDADIIAVYEINSYKVTYVTNDIGNSVAPSSVAYGSKIENLQSLKRTGFEFDGWYTDEALKNRWNINTDVVTDNITLYAKWTQVYTLTFKIDDVKEHNIIKTVRSGEILTDIPEVPEIVGKIGQWQYTNGNVVDFSAYIILKDESFKAVYTVAMYYVTFHFDDGNSDYIIQVAHGSKVTSTPTSPEHPEKEGYVFDGWDKDPALYEIVGTTVFYPTYTINKYNVKYAVKAADIGAEEDLIMKNYNVDYGSIAIAPDERPTKEGYSFSGWDKTNPIITQDTVIYATFIIRTFTVSFRDDGNNVFYDAENVKYNTYVQYEGTTPSITGWDFLGWDYDGDGSYDAIKDAPLSNPITDNKIILAKFDQTKVTVSYETGVNAVEIPPETVIYGSKLTQVTPVHNNPNMAFFGWFLEAEFKNRYEFNTVVKSDFILYAKWEEMVDGSNGVVYEYDSVTDSYRVKSVPAGSTIIRIANNYQDEYGTHRSVTAIASGAMQNCTSLTTVYLPTSITSIGAGAFAGCTKLNTVAQEGNVETGTGYALLPNNIESIGDSAFSKCTSLKGIYVSESDSLLNNIGSGAFSGCTSLTGFRFPNHVDTEGVLTQIEIQSRAFAGCSAMTTLAFPQSIYYIGDNAFKDATSLRYVNFESTTPPTMESTAFTGCSKSFRIYVASSTETPTQYTTDMASGWQTYKDILLSSGYVTLDGNWSYTIINSGALMGKLRLIQYIGTNTSAVIESTIRVLDTANGNPAKEIGEVANYAFDYIPTEISFDSSLTINTYTFEAAINLQHLSVKINASNNLSSDVILNTYNSLPGLNKLSISAAMRLTQFFGGNTVPTNLTTVNIINDTAYPSIPASMFEGCSSIVSVNIPTQVRTIEDYAFKGCTSLTTVKMTTVTTIGKEAFSGCTSLATEGLNLPTTVVNIGEDAFKGTKFITEKTAESLSAASIAENGGGFVILGGGVLYKYVGNSVVVRLPSKVKIINTKAFYGNSSVRTVVFTSDKSSVGAVARIGAYAFANCFFLENVIMPNTLATVEDGAFLGDSKLVKFIIIEVNSGIIVPTVGDSAFGNTKTDKVLYLPNQGMYEEFTAEGVTSWTSVFGTAILTKTLLLETNRVLCYENASTVSLVQYFGEQTSMEMADYTTIEKSGSKIAVSSIYAYAFPRSITSITISAAIIYDAKAFAAVTNLTSLTITSSGSVRNENRSILYNVLKANSELTTLNVSGDQTIANLFGAIPTGVALNTVNITEGSNQIVAEMFKDCTEITAITFPSTLNMDYIYANAFAGSGWLNNATEEFVTIPTMQGRIIVAYKGSDNIVTIPTDSDIKGLAPSLFAGNTDLEIIYIGSNITNIYGNAFKNAKALIKVFIEGATAPTVTYGAFSGLATGAELYVQNTSAYGSSSFSVFTKKNNTTVKSGDYIYEPISGNNIRLVQCLDSSAGVSVPDTIGGLTVTAIGNNIFLKDVTAIGVNGDDTFADNSFKNLFNLESVTVYNTSAYIAANGAKISSLFSSNASLNCIEYKGDITLKTLLGTSSIPAGLATIKVLYGATSLVDHMLAGASSVSNIDLPVTLTSVGSNVFEDTAWYSRKSDFVILFDSLLYKYKGNSKTPNIPKQVARINAYAFSTYSASGWSGNQLITSLRFANDSACTYIAKNAFYGCSNLAKVDLPDAIEYVDKEAFTNTKIATASSGLLIVEGSSKGSVVIYYGGTATSVVIPYDVVGITQNAFAGRTALQTVSIATGSSLTYVREGAFSGCTALTNFGIGGSNANLPSKLTDIGANAFANTPWFTNSSDFVMNGGRLLLYTGTAKDITVGSGITAIASHAFSSVSGITSVKFTSETPVLATNMGDGALDSVPVIYVPAAGLDAYKGAWTAYASKIQSY